MCSSSVGSSSFPKVCLKHTDCWCVYLIITRFSLLSEICADQDPYDFIDPNPDEEGLSEGDTQNSVPYVSCIKVYILQYSCL